MDSNQIRQRFLDFFKKRGHTVIPSASLVPENDPTVLFNTAGMQPLMPYFFGKKHPAGDRLVDSQKCVRTVDIEGIGDNTHATFFEMLGNWSLGSYFKKEAIEWSYEFLTSKEEGLGLDPKRLYVTCFEGDSNAPKDIESAEAWQHVGLPENRIYFKGVDSNWWPAVKKYEDSWTGPTGTCTEMFYDVTEEGLGDLSFEEFEKADEDQKVIEIWNDVFMEYEKKDGKIIGKLEQKNVDTGAGLERVIAVVQKKSSIFETDLFGSILSPLESNKDLNLKQRRIIADHLRTAVFIISDGVVPSNKDRGYILRRLLRQVLAIEHILKISPQVFEDVIIAVINKYADSYPELTKNRDSIINTYFAESAKFKSTLDQGIREINKYEEIDAEKAFHLYESFGLPFEVVKDTAPNKTEKLSREDFDKKFKEHQELSRAGAEQKFKNL